MPLPRLPASWLAWGASIALHALVLAVFHGRQNPPASAPLKVELRAADVISQPVRQAAQPHAQAPKANAAQPSAPVLSAPAGATETTAVAPAPPPAAAIESRTAPAASPIAAPAASAPEKPLADSAYLSRSVFALMNARKRYPAMARRLGLEGQVVIEAVINERGQLQSAEIRQSSGFELLDQDALALLKSVTPLALESHRIAANTRVQIPLRYALE